MSPMQRSSNSDNKVWKIQVWWPFRSEYRIAFVEPDYSYAIIARSKRDHVWLIGRRPQLSNAAYTRYSSKISSMGYDISKFARTQQNGDFPTPGLNVSVPVASH
ncbi:lipocalin family protein [uncultured Nevskia sp.]|uniref:lipocalin family protein n=1 Tax=uncultured Nevskia sp. TaxID=228950 RepID=UPI0025D14433|nr:lipocalin family protein [uncultured Nevskia sp.]